MRFGFKEGKEMKNRLCAKILVMVLLLLLLSSIMTSGMAISLFTTCSKCGTITQHTKKGVNPRERDHYVNWVCNDCGTPILSGWEDHWGGTADLFYDIILLK